MMGVWRPYLHAAALISRIASCQVPFWLGSLPALRIAAAETVTALASTATCFSVMSAAAFIVGHGCVLRRCGCRDSRAAGILYRAAISIEKIKMAAAHAPPPI